MRLKCNRCGRPVSTEVPDHTVVRGWIECPECIEQELAVSIIGKAKVDEQGTVESMKIASIFVSEPLKK